jgi:hypothetical protein
MAIGCEMGAVDLDVKPGSLVLDIAIKSSSNETAAAILSNSESLAGDPAAASTTLGIPIASTTLPTQQMEMDMSQLLRALSQQLGCVLPACTLDMSGTSPNFQVTMTVTQGSASSIATQASNLASLIPGATLTGTVSSARDLISPSPPPPTPPPPPLSPPISPPSPPFSNETCAVQCFREAAPDFSTGNGYQYYTEACFLADGLPATERPFGCTGRLGCRLCRTSYYSGLGPDIGLCPKCVFDYYSLSTLAPVSPPTPPKPPPPVQTEIPCTADAAANVCGSSGQCFLDVRCTTNTSQDPYGGLGCNAGGVAPGCRFCGFGDYRDIICPDNRPGLTLPDQGGPMPAIASGAGALIALIVCIVVVRIYRRSVRSAQDKGKGSKDNFIQDLDSVRPKIPGHQVDDDDAQWSTKTKSAEDFTLDEMVERDGIIRWDRVSLDRRLDRGAMGALFRATLDKEAEPLVLRRLNIEYLALHSHSELVTQVDALKALSHPNLLGVLGLATDGLRNYGTLMEYLPRSLARVLARAESNAETANKVKAVWLSMMTDIAKATAYLHGEKVYHYSLHPRNVLFDGFMTVKLADFGRSPATMARLLNDEDNEVPTGEPRQLYIAPELLRLESYTAAADVWSLGCLMARITSLKNLYAQDSADGIAMSHHAILMRVTAGEMSPADQVASLRDMAYKDNLLALIKDCTTLDPSKRPTSPQVMERLEGLSAPPAAITAAARRRSTCLPGAIRLPPSSSAPGVVSNDPEEEAMQKAKEARVAAKAAQRRASVTAMQDTDVIEVFNRNDPDKTGVLAIDQLARALSELGLVTKKADAERVLKKYDRSGKGSLDAPHFEKLVRDLRRFKAERAAKKAKETAEKQGQGGASTDPPSSALSEKQHSHRSHSHRSHHHHSHRSHHGDEEEDPEEMLFMAIVRPGKASPGSPALKLDASAVVPVSSRSTHHSHRSHHSEHGEADEKHRPHGPHGHHHHHHHRSKSPKQDAADAKTQGPPDAGGEVGSDKSSDKASEKSSSHRSHHRSHSPGEHKSGDHKSGEHKSGEHRSHQHRSHSPGEHKSGEHRSHQHRSHSPGEHKSGEHKSGEHRSHHHHHHKHHHHGKRDDDGSPGSSASSHSSHRSKGKKKAEIIEPASGSHSGSPGSSAMHAAAASPDRPRGAGGTHEAGRTEDDHKDRRKSVSFGPAMVASVPREASERCSERPSGAAPQVLADPTERRRRDRVSAVGAGRGAGSSDGADAVSAAGGRGGSAAAKARREALRAAGKSSDETLVDVAAESTVRANRVCI